MIFLVMACILQATSGRWRRELTDPPLVARCFIVSYPDELGDCKHNWNSKSVQLVQGITRQNLGVDGPGGFIARDFFGMIFGSLLA